MIKVLLVSQNESDNALVQRKLQVLKPEFGAMSFATTRPASLNSVLDLESNLIIYNCTVYNSGLLDMAGQLRNQGYLGPLMILAKIPEIKYLAAFQAMQNVVVIEKPYEKKDLIGISRKFLKDAQVNQRQFRRFETAQSVMLESYERDFTAQSAIQNISRGGVLIKGQLDDMAKGDLMRVNFSLDQINKTHTMSAKVVWTDGDVDSPEREAGLQFMSREAIYSHLLNHI